MNENQGERLEPRRKAESEPRRERLFALILFALAWLLYLAFFRWARTITPDGFIYLELARNLPETGWEVLGEPHQKFLPLYPALLALLNLLTGETLGADTWGFLVSLTSGALLPPLVFFMSRDWGASGFSSLLLGSLMGILPLGLAQYSDINVLPLFTFLFTFMFFQIQRGKFFRAGLLAGLALTTRYELYLFLPVFVFAYRREFRLCLRAGLGFLLTASPWWLRNFLLYHQINHTYYWAELTQVKFHLPEILLGLLLHFGPVLLLLAGLGFSCLSRRGKILLAGFSLLYLSLHTIWWYYHDRFLLPLAPFLLAVAAPGLDQLKEVLRTRWPPRFSFLFPLLLCLLVAPLLAGDCILLYSRLAGPADPYLQAGQLLKQEPGDATVLASNPLRLSYYSGRSCLPLSSPSPGQSPHQLVLQHYLERRTRFLLWDKEMPVDVTSFNFLKSGAYQSVRVSEKGETYQLKYLFFREFRAGDELILLYRLQAERIE